MLTDDSGRPDLAARGRRFGTPGRWVAIAIAGIVLARSAVFVFWEQTFIDSNQAVIGLMAKHLVELRAFPVFMYGQNYLLAVEAWLAAPIFLIAGVSVTALKLPLLAINVAIALLLLQLLRRQAHVPPVFAGIATLFFALPPPGTASQFLEASGAIVEPLFYVLLLWTTWHRPLYGGLVLGIGVLHREFTLYGLLALLILDAGRGDLFTRTSLRRLSGMLGVTAAIWLGVHVLSGYSSAMGPGTSVADLRHEESPFVHLAGRLSVNWDTLPRGLWRIATLHWPALFGTSVIPVRRFDVETQIVQGMPGLWLPLAAAMLWAAGRIAARLARERTWRREYDFCAYLVIVAVLSVLGYVVGHGGVVTLRRMRYDMLSAIGAVGLAGWYLTVERSKVFRTAWVSAVLAWALVGALAHGRLWSEYLWNAPTGGKQRISRALAAEGIRYGVASYRDAYVVTFLTRERIILASSDRVRIASYHRDVAAHRREAVRIERSPCAGGRVATDAIYLCPPRG